MKLLYKFIECTLLIIQPICPYFVADLWEYSESLGIKFKNQWVWKSDMIDQKYNGDLKYYSDILFNVSNMCNSTIARMNKKNKKVNGLKVIIYNEFTEVERQIIDVCKKYICETHQQEQNKDDWKNFVTAYLKTVNSKHVGNHAKFMNYLKLQIDKYGTKWFNYVEKQHNSESMYYKKWLPKMAPINIVFEEKESGQESLFKFGPGCPCIVCL